MGKLIGFICKNHAYVNFEKDNGICPVCGCGYNGEKRLAKSFFDITSNQEINVSDIDKICKEKGYVYGDDEDISRECERNRNWAEREFKREIHNKLYNNIMEQL